MIHLRCVNLLLVFFGKEGAVGMAKKKYLGELLIDAGFLTPEQLDECVKIVESTDRRLGDVAVEKGFLNQDELYRVLENQHRVTYVDLDKANINSETAKIITPELARRNKVIPVKLENNVLYIAIDDPKNFQALDEVRMASRMDVQPMLASRRSIATHLDRIYGNEFAQRALSDHSKEIDYDEIVSEVVDAKTDDIASAPIVRLVNSLMEQAVNMRASDIHIEPMGTSVRVRMRVDGVLNMVLEAPPTTASPITARLKIMGGLNIAERRTPQDGRFNVKVAGRELDARLSILPTVHGEKSVIRLLDRNNFLVPKEKLGFTEKNLAKFDNLLHSPHGIILITGPTGSGKSTTLYTMLSEINDVQDNLVTVEDPVEYMIDGLNQVQVNAKAGMTFASGLRSILRQDPDVIMIGEIRDVETVEIAIKAAITGHLVLSTIHTNDSVSTIYRLIDMGVPSYMVSAAIVGIIAQRLVRVICPKCKAEYTPTKAELDMAGIESWSVSSMTFYKGRGCQECNQFGYKGRMAVHEILVFDNDIRELIQNGASVNEMKRHALETGMNTIRDSIIELLNKGLTTVEELINVAHTT